MTVPSLFRQQVQRLTDQQAQQQNDRGDSNQNQAQNKDQNAGSKPEQQETDLEDNNQNQSAKNNLENAPQQKPLQDQRVPGKMTREEARQLLDTLKDGEKKLPAAPSKHLLHL